jgi:hypothetical protein
MTEANPADKSPEELRAELTAKRAQLGDTIEELAHRVDVPSQVKAKRDETVAKLQDAKAHAAQRVHEGSEKVKAALADKAPVVQEKVDRARAVYAEKAPPAVQHTVDQAVAKSKAVYAEQAPAVQDKVARAQGVLAEKAPPVERTLRERPGLVAAVAVALVALLIARSGRKKT